MITCSRCGYDQNHDLARFCAQCAAPLGGDLAPPDSGRGKTLAANTVLQGRYTVLEKLAEGGMGAVYLAQDTKLFNRVCVVKEMLPFYTTDEERRVAERNFEREARTLAGLRHPGIPEIYDYFIEDDRYYLVMAFVEGEDLGKLLARQAAPFSEDDVIRYGLQLARLLTYLASLNPPIIHRDIKPANIIVERSTGQVKLVDFGIARSSIRSERLDVTGSIIMGTRGYAPPEQYSGEASLASDVYALGATLHHLLTGKHPTRGGGTLRPVRESRPEVAPALDGLVQEMVRLDADQRPTADQVKERLERLSGTQVAKTAFVMRNGAEVYSAGELVKACEQSPETGRFHLAQGHLRDWFLAQNRHDLADLAQSCLAQAPDEKVALEWFLRGLEPDLPVPQLALDEEVIDFGEVERDSSYSLLVPFTNRTRGYLVTAAGSQAPWLKVETEYAGCYPGEQGQIQVTLDTREMPAGTHVKDALALAWEQEQRSVPVRLTVLWPPGGQLSPPLLDLGLLMADEPPAAREITLHSTGGSDWVGRAYSETPWLTLAGGAFRIPSQGHVRLPVMVYPQRMTVGQRHRGTISVVSNGGSQVAAMIARPAKRWYIGRARLRRWLAFAAPALLSAAGLGFGMAHLAEGVLGLARPALSALYSVLIGLVAWILGLLAAATFVPALDELENFHHGGDLALDLPVGQFRTRRALGLAVVGGLAGLVIGLNATRAVPAGASRGVMALAGLFLGALAGLGAAIGSSDPLHGTRLLPGLGLLARRPAILRLCRTALTSASLAILAVLLALRWNGPRLESAALAAWTGLLLTSDGYPYWPLRLHQLLSWLRPAARAVVAAYGVYLVAWQLGWGSLAAWTGWWRVTAIAPNMALPMGATAAALLAGALLGIAAHDEVGFSWQREMRRTGPLALILILLTALLAWAFLGVLVPIIGPAAGWLSLALTLAAAATLALGLSGRSRIVRGWLEQGRGRAAGWLQQFQIPDQAQGLMQRGSRPLRWLSGATAESSHHPAVLASGVLIAVLVAPLLSRLFGALLWLLVVAGVVAGVLWWRSRSKAAAGQGGAR